MKAIVLFTTILSKLWNYDKWKTIGENIKKFRTKLGLTQDDLSKRADIKYTTLTKVESGVVKKPSVQTMAKIAKGLVVTIDELIK